MSHPMPGSAANLKEFRELFSLGESKPEMVWAEEKGKVFGVKGEEGVVPVLGHLAGGSNRRQTKFKRSASK